MAQPSVASFFNTRKRAAAEDGASVKSRRNFESEESSEPNSSIPSHPNPVQDDDISNLKAATTTRTRSSRLAVKRIGTYNTTDVPQKLTKVEPTAKQQKLVQFIKKGPLSPRKKVVKPTYEMQKTNEQTPSTKEVSVTNTVLHTAFASKNNATNIDRGLKTPTKQIIKGGTPLKHGGELKSLVRKELNFDEVKTKLTRSAKLQELKASLSRINELEQTRKTQEERNRRLRDVVAPSTQKKPPVQLQQFDTIELEVLTSPAKAFKTPTKFPPPTPDKNELMSPRLTDVSKRVLLSPAKMGSPSKLTIPPAYQRFMGLVETGTAGKLMLPYKYRYLIELFKGLDSVCAMFHNRKECITFKKLKPAVQRMLRKNFTEMHLAQIKQVYPEAFVFTQMKMRNYGSMSKADYFQLVITPNVANSDKLPDKQKLDNIDEDNVFVSARSSIMNPQVMIERLQRFQMLLLQRVKDEHDKFLKSLDPPLLIPKDKVTRWHPDFDLEKCPNIGLAHLPQPPNMEKYSSARDILSTARNLFNCATPMERAMERYEANVESMRTAAENVNNTGVTKNVDSKSNADDKADTTKSQRAAQNTGPPISVPIDGSTVAANDVTATLLKGVPKSLLDRIRAKQAAKALDAMTRRPSQDQEATKYSRLPELARHLRNVFITERKSVLTLELIIKKIQNSFRTCLMPHDIEAHLKLIAKEVPDWLSFHEVRKTMYLKIVKDMDMNKVLETLEVAANEKSN